MDTNLVNFNGVDMKQAYDQSCKSKLIIVVRWQWMKPDIIKNYWIKMRFLSEGQVDFSGIEGEGFRGIYWYSFKVQQILLDTVQKQKVLNHLWSKHSLATIVTVASCEVLQGIVFEFTMSHSGESFGVLNAVRSF